MSRWLVGDIQGCAREFETLLDTIRFDSGRDEIWCLGDLISRGPDSLAVLRLWRSIGGKGVLGNHEVKTLLAQSGRSGRSLKQLRDLFEAPDAGELLEELRRLPALVFLKTAGAGPDVWAVHAGLDPRWDDLESVARKLNRTVRSDESFLDPDLEFATRVRCCDADGTRSPHSGPPQECPAPFRPWDEHYRGETFVVHGHWAARGHYRGKRTMGLDSGCVYGGGLTAWCQDEDRIVQIKSQ